MQIKIRAAISSDGPQLAKFNALAFARNPEFDPDIIVDWVNSDSALDYFNRIAASDNYCILALSDNQIIGYLSTESASHVHRKSKYLEIVNLGVHPDCRRQGVANLLLRHCEKWAKEQGFTRLELSCYYKNSGALAYYGQAGFDPMNLVLEKTLEEF